MCEQKTIDHPMRSTPYISKILLVLVLSGIAGTALATSMDDCRKRVVVAMENAKALGGTQADEEKFGNHAANECVKEVRASQQANSETTTLTEVSNETSPITIIVFAVIVALIGYFAWPYLNGTSKKAAAEEAGIVEQVRISQDLREKLGSKIRHMTIDEIAQATQATRRGTITWLARNKTICKDFDGQKATSTSS